MIDAHGVQFFMGNTRRVEFTVPNNVALHFYVQHNSPLPYFNYTSTYAGVFGNDRRDYHYSSSLDDVMIGRAAVVETLRAGQSCPDYVLTKI